MNNDQITLNQAIKLADELCTLMYTDYRITSREVIDVLSERMTPRDEADDEVDGVLGHALSESSLLVYDDGEMYLRLL